MTTLFFDTETTGKADFKAPPTAAHQPSLVQLGCILCDDHKIVAELGCLVVQSGIIPAEATAVHGITDNDCKRFGWNCVEVTESFLLLVASADILVAYNHKFDKLVMDKFLGPTYGAYKLWANAKFSDPMLDLTPVCKLPGLYGKFKWPKLQEAYRIVLGKELVDAHSALGDVRATMELYWWLEERGMARVV